MNEQDAAYYKRHRFPPAIIAHAVWLYFRFALSYRDVEELLAERGVIMTHETVRQWCRTFGQQYANELRRRRSRPGDKWHFDEVFISISGVQHYLWRAVDQDGTIHARPRYRGSYAISLITSGAWGQDRQIMLFTLLFKPRSAAIPTLLPHLALGIDDDQRD